MLDEKNEYKKTVSFRIDSSAIELINLVSEKYKLSKSKVVNDLVKKYVREEYGNLEK